MAQPVSWNLQLSVQPDRLEDLRQVMADMVETTRGEAGVLQYEWYIDATASTCHTTERYADSQAVLTHLSNFATHFADRFLACVKPTALYVYGEPSDEARAALDGFGAVYLGSFGGFHH